jgi:CRP/FNR family transcriptional regulator, cyclic AMP receptor protein
LKVNLCQKSTGRPALASYVLGVKGDIDLRTRVGVHPFLAVMEPHHLDLLAECASIKQFEKNEMIFRATEPANGFYLIENGSVALEDWVSQHGPITIDTLVAGEPMGWSWIFPPYAWHFSARAIESTTALFFDADRLHKYCNEDLTLGHELFKRMSEVMVRRLQKSRSKIIELSRSLKAPNK